MSGVNGRLTLVASHKLRDLHAAPPGSAKTPVN